MPQTATEPAAHDMPPDALVSRIDVEKALKLRLVNKLSYQAIADQMGVSKQAVWERLQRVFDMLEDPETVGGYKANRADLMAGVEFAMVSEILDQDKLKKASVNNLAYGIRQFYDMQRLETGQSTENIAYKDMSEDLTEIEAELADIQGETVQGGELPEYDQLEANYETLSENADA